MARTQKDRKTPLSDGDTDRFTITSSFHCCEFPAPFDDDKPATRQAISSPLEVDPDAPPLYPLPPKRVSPPYSSSDENDGRPDRQSPDHEDSGRMYVLPGKRGQESSDTSEKDTSGSERMERAAVSVTPSEYQFSTLERVRRLKILNQKCKQYNLLKKYFDRLKRAETTMDWYQKPDEESQEDISGYDVMPCACHLHDEDRFLGDNDETVDESEAEMTSDEMKDATMSPVPPSDEMKDATMSPVPPSDPGEHNITCDIKRLCAYFAAVAKYFTGKDVHPDLFLLDNPPKTKFYGTVADYSKSTALYGDRRVVRFNLRKEIDSLLETTTGHMSEESMRELCERNQNREDIYQCMRDLLKELICYNDSTDDEKSESPQSTMKQRIKKRINLNQDAYNHQMLHLKHLIKKKIEERKEMGPSEPKSYIEVHLENDDANLVELQCSTQINRATKHKLRRSKEHKPPRSENESSNGEPQEKKFCGAEEVLSISELSLEETNNNGDEAVENVHDSDLEVANNVEMILIQNDLELADNEKVYLIHDNDLQLADNEEVYLIRDNDLELADNAEVILIHENDLEVGNNYILIQESDLEFDNNIEMP